MVKILLVNKNKETGNPTSHGYPAYDFRATPDIYARASIFGKVVQAKKTETRNWSAFKSGDPYKETRGGKLLLADYGNYVRISGQVDGKNLTEYTSHHKANTLSVSVGQEVKPGQIIAEIGNTGNSTGSHEHKEFRDENNKTIPVEFVDEMEDEMEKLPKDSIIRDIYIFTRTTPASQDDIDFWIQNNKNLQEIGESILTGDGEAKKKWLEKWEIPDQDIDLDTKIDTYDTQRDMLKEALAPMGIKYGDNFATILGKIVWMVTELNKIEDTIKEAEGKAKEAVKNEKHIGDLKISNIIIRFLMKGGD